MIILRIPRKVQNKNLREFILNNIKKFRRNQKRKHIKLQGEIAYSQDYVYFLFPDRGLELAFALSLYLKCEKHNITCELELSRPVDLEKLPTEIVEAAKVWAEKKLHRKYYKLKNLKL
ncbi:MAG: hypothetical protein J7J20_02795 [Desulfurococcales archaeon]|nr:hypothetical protein [Desulfurococcales archaeon]